MRSPKTFAPSTPLPFDAEDILNSFARGTTVVVGSPEMGELEIRLSAHGEARREVNRLLLSAVKAIDEKFSDLSGEQRGEQLSRALHDMAKRISEHNASLPKVDVSLQLPALAEVLFVPGESGKPSEFLQLHWGKYIKAGVCFRPDILRLDARLHTALKNEFAHRPAEYRAILPTKSDEVDARIKRELGEPVRPEKRAKQAGAARHIKYAKS